MGKDAPTMLRFMVGVGDWMKEYAVVLLMCAVAAVVILVYYTSKTASGIRVKDTFMMKTPVVGKVVLHGRLARLSNNMAILLSAGIPLTEGFHLMIQGSDSVLMKEALTEVNVKIHAGESLSTAMQTQRVFPLLFTQMVEVGEMTGRLETNLEIVGVYYEEEADKSMSKMVSTLGPGMMVFIGITVGTLVITMFSSLYGMYGSIGEGS
jgi:type IV pilus assembly protein PilC